MGERESKGDDLKVKEGDRILGLVQIGLEVNTEETIYKVVCRHQNAGQEHNILTDN